MKVTGIIMECNPFHEGHRYLLRKAREDTGADRIIVAMSGNFVQRGAPAIINKEVRTKWLLENGADLVLELPLYAACAGADYFARGGIALLDSLGCVDSLCFGSESGDAGMLMRAADMFVQEDGLFKEALRDGLRKGHTWPQAREMAAEKVFGVVLPHTPNDLLGFEYCRAIRSLGSSIRVHAVRRIDVPSASELREAMLGGKALPDIFAGYCREHRLMSGDSFSQALLYALVRAVSNPDGDLTQYLDVTREMADRIANNIGRYESFSSFCDLIKTRNLTYTRISRALMHILLGMTDSEMGVMERCGMAPFARPLGFRKEASDLLRVISGSSKISFLSRLSGAKDILSPGAYLLFRRELFSDTLYDLVSSPGKGVGELRKKIIVV